MKKIIFSALALCAAITSNAQENNSTQMYIHMKSGEVVKIACDDIDSLTFKESGILQEVGFDVEVTDLKATNLTYKITPTDDNVTYFFDILPKAKYETEKGNRDGNIFGFDKAWYQQMADWYGGTFFDYMKKDLSQGTNTVQTDPYDAPKQWNSEYVIYVYGMNDDGTQSTAVTEKVVKMAEPLPSDNVITAEISEITKSSIYLDITTTNDDQYFIYVSTKKFVDSFDDDEELTYEYIYRYSNSPLFFKNGNYSGSEGFTSLKANTDYTLVIFGYDDDWGPSTAVQKIEFHTPAE